MYTNKEYQKPKNYILTLFKDYHHSGFSQGFNIGKAIWIAIVDSLPL